MGETTGLLDTGWASHGAYRQALSSKLPPLAHSPQPFNEKVTAHYETVDAGNFRSHCRIVRENRDILRFAFETEFIGVGELGQGP